MTSKRQRRHCSYSQVVRRVIATLLLVAAGLKAHAILVNAPPADPWIIALIFGEALLALALVLWDGLAIRRTALAAFSGFALVAAYKGLSKEASCGCFGILVQVHPWTTFWVDCTIIVLIIGLGNCHREDSVERIEDFAVASAPHVDQGMRWPFYVLVTAMLAIAVVNETSIRNAKIRGQAITVDPQVVIGKRLSLLKYIAAPVDLEQGSWTLVLYRPECGKCKAVMPCYRRLVSTRRNNILLVDVSGGTEARAVGATELMAAWVRQGVTVIADTPLEIRIGAGIVQTVRDSGAIRRRFRDSGCLAGAMTFAF